MKKLAIIGNGPYAMMMREYLEMDFKGELCAYVVDELYIDKKEIQGIPVLSFEHLKEKYETSEITLIMGIGYTQMGDVRKRIFELCKSMGYHFENYIHSTAIIAPNVQIGEGNNILEGVILESGVMVGNANLFFCGAMIAHETKIGSYNTFSVRSSVAGCTNIKNNCFMGIASVVKDHVTINDYALLGAAAYGYKDIPSYSVVTPAKSVLLKDKISTDYL